MPRPFDRKPAPQEITVYFGKKPRPLWQRLAPYLPLVVLMAAVAVATFPRGPAPATFGALSPVPATSGALPTGAASPTDDPNAVIRAADEAINALDARLSALDVRCSSLQDAPYASCSATYDALSMKGQEMTACLGAATTLRQVQACVALLPR